MSKTNCACPNLDAMECVRRRHIGSSCDDFQRSRLAEEADCFDSSDACECICHDHEDDYEIEEADEL